MLAHVCFGNSLWWPFLHFAEICNSFQTLKYWEHCRYLVGPFSILIWILFKSWKIAEFSEIDKIAQIEMKMFCNCVVCTPCLLCLLSLYGFRLTRNMVKLAKCKFFQALSCQAKDQRFFMVHKVRPICIRKLFKIEFCEILNFLMFAFVLF